MAITDTGTSTITSTITTTSTEGHPVTASPIAPAGGPAAWTADTLERTWCRPFTPGEIDALDAMLARIRSLTPDLDLATVTADTLAVGGLEPLVEDLRTRLVDGQGVVAHEGFPVADYSTDELRALWWGLAVLIGTPLSQSHRGDVIGDVRDIGTGITGKAGRGYTSNAELNFHADVADLSGLFFLRTAREGGTTRLASSVTVHDEMAARFPDLLAELYRPMPCSWQSNQPAGQPGWYDIPVYGRSDAGVSCNIVRTNILLAHQNTGAPALTERQIEAVHKVVEVAGEPHMWVERHFEPGTMLWVHNHTTLHLRSGFVDWDEPERKRHLLRVWVCPPNSRHLPDSFASFFADTSAGGLRGGYPTTSPHPLFQTT